MSNGLEKLEIPELDDGQLRAAEAMVRNKSFLLFSDPGAGKTLTALRALVDVAASRQSAKALIVCPPIATRTWQTWIKAVYDQENTPCSISVISSGNSPVTEGATHVIVSYSLLSRENGVKDRLLAWEADVIICDESDNLAGDTSARTRAVFGHNYKTGGLAEKPEFAWFLTGTPIPRYHDGLYPVLRCRFDWRLKKMGIYNKKMYLETFCTTRMVKYGRMRIAKEQVSGSKNEKLMNVLLFAGDNPIAARNKLVLPPPDIRVVTVTPQFSDRFISLEAEALGEVDDGNMFTSSAQGVVEISPKLSEAFRALGEEMAGSVIIETDCALRELRSAGYNTGILLLYWHKSVGETLEVSLRSLDWRVGRIGGDTNRQTRADVEDMFNSGALDVCVGQIASMGVALNLQHNCHTVIFSEETFSAAANLQAYQRVWRRGQKNKVSVTIYRANCELAELKARVLSRKSKSASKSLDAQ